MLASTARNAARTLPRRLLSTTARLRDDNSPRPPRPIGDSTSALDYKQTQRHRTPPPLPVMDVPRSRSAEEAVTNILYNTPPKSLQPFKKCVPAACVCCVGSNEAAGTS
jgi:acetolactate synthase-1/3 small subunit